MQVIIKVLERFCVENVQEDFLRNCFTKSDIMKKEEEEKLIMLLKDLADILWLEEVFGVKDEKRRNSKRVVKNI